MRLKQKNLWAPRRNPRCAMEHQGVGGAMSCHHVSNVRLWYSGKEKKALYPLFYPTRNYPLRFGSPAVSNLFSISVILPLFPCREICRSDKVNVCVSLILWIHFHRPASFFCPTLIILVNDDGVVTALAARRQRSVQRGDVFKIGKSYESRKVFRWNFREMENEVHLWGKAALG